jgi:hypothetical protein
MLDHFDVRRTVAKSRASGSFDLEVNERRNSGRGRNVLADEDDSRIRLGRSKLKVNVRSTPKAKTIHADGLGKRSLSAKWMHGKNKQEQVIKRLAKKRLAGIRPTPASLFAI